MIEAIKRTLKDWIDPDDPRRRALRLEQLKLAARNSHAGLTHMPTMVLAIAGGLSFWAPWANMVAWAAMALMSGFALRRFLTPYLGPLDPADLKSLTVRLAVANTGQITIFSLLAPLAWPDGAPMGQALVQLVLAATMSSVGSITGPSRPIFVTDLVPLAIASTVTPLVFDGWVGAPFAILSFLFAILMVENANGGYLLAEKALTLNDANLELIGELRAASKAKSQFLANMSHELRTPLNAILGFSEVMKDEMMGPMGSRTYKSYAADIHGSGQHLLSLVNDVLDLAKIEAGKYELTDEIIPLEAVAETMLRLFGVQAKAAGISLVDEVDRSLLVRWDARAAKQISINLMSNAIKFTPSGGTITLSARRSDDGGSTISIRDTGCGIAPEYHATIFEEFGQGRHDVAQAQAGTGLGLPIVRALVELHGGRVMLTSAVGCGTEISVAVPAERTMVRSVELGPPIQPGRSAAA